MGILASYSSYSSDLDPAKNLQENTEDSAGVQEVYKINLEYFLKVGFEGNQERGIPGLGVIYPSLLEVEPSSNRNISNLYHLN